MPNSKNEKDMQDIMLAQILLDLQQEDDNPYDVSDEILVAYSEGKLSKAEAEVVQACLVNNPEALASSVALTQNHITSLALDEAKQTQVSLVSRVITWFESHKLLSLSGVGSALATSFAFVLLVSGNVYKDLDKEFSLLQGQTSGTEVMWGFSGQSDYEQGLYQIKGANDDYVYQGFQSGLKEGLSALVALTPEQRTILKTIPNPSQHCNNALPIDECLTVLKQGRYLGKWLAMAFVNCNVLKSTDWINQHLESALDIVHEAKLSQKHILSVNFKYLQTTPNIEQCQYVADIVENNSGKEVQGNK